MESQPLTHNPAQVKDVRVGIDSLIVRIEQDFGVSRELALVKTKLQEAKMWAGKELERLGYVLPTEFQDKAPAIIAPVATTEPTPAAPPAGTPAPEHIVENPDEAAQPVASVNVVEPGSPQAADPTPTTPAGDKIDIPVTDAGEVTVEPEQPTA